MNNTWRPVGYALLFASVYLGAEFIFARTVALSAVPLLIGGFLLWRFGTKHEVIDPSKVMIPYLLTVMAFTAHVYEEYRGFVLGYPSVLKGFVELDLNTLLSHAAFLSPIIWIAAAVMMLKRWTVGFYMACVFLFGMMFMEPTHYIAPFLDDGTWHYVGGMWTAFLPAVLGWYTFLKLRSETKKTRRK